MFSTLFFVNSVTSVVTLLMFGRVTQFLGRLPVRKVVVPMAKVAIHCGGCYTAVLTSLLPSHLD